MNFSKRTWVWIGVIAAGFLAGLWLGEDGDDDPVPFVATSSTQGLSTATTTVSSTGTPVATTAPAPKATTTSEPVTLPAGWASAVVIGVIDGDTIDVRLEDGSEERLRLIGTNSPEDGECYADEATSGLRDLIDGETVHLEPDRSDRDQFGRLLRYVWTTDDRFVNAITVERGWALAREYPPDTARADELEAAQEQAMEAPVGMWASAACGTPIPADLRIDHVEYDAPGNDNFNQNGEWAEIVNHDDVPIDLTGWVLKDTSASHRYHYPVGFTLEPGATVSVYTGCGPDTTEALYWCVSGSAVWNNSGDTAFLLDPDGNIVYSYAYE